MIKLEQYNNNKNLHKLVANNIIIWFSYETPIAFQTLDEWYDKQYTTNYIAKNEWSNTTGKHLGVIKEELKEYLEVRYEVLLGIIKNYI